MTPLRVVSIEEHFSTEEAGIYQKAVFDHSVGIGAQVSARLRDPGLFIQEMDRAGIDFSVLSQTAPGVQAEPDAGRAASVATQTNDALQGIIETYPGRLGGFAHLALHNAEIAAHELERTVTEYGFHGAMVNGPTLGKYLDAEEYLPFWERANDLGVPVYLHPAPVPERESLYGPHPYLGNVMWGWGHETGTHALRIVLSGLFDRFPRLQLILGHLGETIPYALSRLDRRLDVFRAEGRSIPAKEPIAHYLRNNILVTTSGFYSQAALRCAVEEVGIDRVLLSTDYPYEDTPEAVAMIRQADLDEASRVQLLGGNAVRWLKLDGTM